MADLIGGLRESARLAGIAVVVATIQSVIRVWTLNPTGCDWTVVS